MTREQRASECEKRTWEPVLPGGTQLSHTWQFGVGRFDEQVFNYVSAALVWRAVSSNGKYWTRLVDLKQCQMF